MEGNELNHVKNKHKRMGYALATIMILIVEIFIALYVHDDFIRPYIGDVLVVIVIYTFIRIWMPNGVLLLPLYIYVFAIFVEVMQYLHIVDILGLKNNRFMSVLIGGTFDWKDIVCYGTGCICLIIFQAITKKDDNNG